MIAEWDARNASNTLEFCMRVTSGPDIVSLCGFVHKSHVGRADLNSFTKEIWSNRGPERKNCAQFQMPSDKYAVVALAASKTPNDADSKVECMILDMETGNPLVASVLGEQINEDTGWISLMTVTAPTATQNSTVGYTMVQS